MDKVTKKREKSKKYFVFILYSTPCNDKNCNFAFDLAKSHANMLYPIKFKHS